ncbi:protein arginine methyltransferase NDUFAF7, mitochondrial-like [Littorina saxatilis]|uniref:Protein arginine methyltransferase NDUFAF7 n=1 Tax=Littorina saxatilis TaxID=31220 RepID=A0AAN9BEQ8_9CAEN
MTCFKTLKCTRHLSVYARFFNSLNSSTCCLQHGKRLSSSASSDDNKVMQYLQARIKTTGPITVAEYMKTVLTSADAGYYMHRDVFGSKGDFITSPEISQMFGEMLGVWCVNEWHNLYPGQPLQVVELGPGRGTLSQDLMRVFCQFADMKDKVSFHLVEISPALSQMQSQLLTDNTKPTDLSDSGQGTDGQSLGPYRQGTTKYGPPISWYRALEDVPKGISFFVGHEFLDALPVHKFQRTEKGWCEVLVDLKSYENTGDKKTPFQFVLSPGRTPATTFLKVSDGDSRDHIEVCPEAGKSVQEVAKRIQQQGGFGLFIDYGHTGQKGDTFRAFKQHELHDPLVEPGAADLTADVDFAYLKQCVEGVSTFGPITQQEFLVNMGIGVRLQMLLQRAKQEDWKSLVTGYDMLTNPTKMGERFKFMALMNPSLPDYVPAGFHTPDFLKTTST